ncbi:MAG: 50S ribosomal protein L24 [Chloroflexia bacterium]|nr:50S ribosomal protein L24 [Chloroflexia bacterium]
MKIRRGDEVVVISGKDKGKRGTVRIVRRADNRIVVEGVNVAKKHQKGRPGVRQAGIIDQENPLNVSNVMLQCPRCSTPTRVGMRVTDTGHRERYCHRCNETVDRT